MTENNNTIGKSKIKKSFILRHRASDTKLSGQRLSMPRSLILHDVQPSIPLSLSPSLSLYLSLMTARSQSQPRIVLSLSLQLTHTPTHSLSFSLNTSFELEEQKLSQTEKNVSFSIFLKSTSRLGALAVSQNTERQKLKYFKIDFDRKLCSKTVA